MKIVIICSVRSGTSQDVYDYVTRLEKEGHQVYLPPRDTPQNDLIGLDICNRMLNAIKICDEVHIFYYPDSQGVHFDLGCAFTLNKRWKLVNNPDDGDKKSYIKVIKALECGRKV